MTYPLPTNWLTGVAFSPANMNNMATLANTLWLLLAAVPALPTARVATVGTETFTISSGNVTTIAGTTIDGVAVSATGAANGFGDYVLIPNAPVSNGPGAGAGVQSTQPGNGLYQVTAVSSNITVVRATSMSASGATATPTGMLVTVLAGSVGTGLEWQVSTPSSFTAFTYGTTAVKFTQVSMTPAGTQTQTNKRITRRVGSIASSATPAINTDNYDVYKMTAQAVPITGWTITGTPVDRDELTLTIKDTGASQPIVWGSPFMPSGSAALPGATPAGKQMTLKFVYDSVPAAWVCMAVDAKGY